MHYIRLLRPPKHIASPGVLQVELVVTITTDLGDSFLCPPNAISLLIGLVIRDAEHGTSPHAVVPLGDLQWAPGQRVAKPRYILPSAAAQALASGQVVELCIKTAQGALSAATLECIFKSITEPNASGLVVPLGVALKGPADKSAGECSTRRFTWGGRGGTSRHLEVDEEIGESIARHVWDAGVVAVAALADAYQLANSTTGEHPLMKALRRVLDGAGPVLNLLELGCGVGILGIGLGAIIDSQCTIVMTDVDNAAGACTRSNIARAQSSSAALSYETLDWHLARHGRFGRQVHRRRWDLIMLSDCTYNADALPALVDTLSALSAANSRQTDGGDAFKTRVLVAMKPRHASESVFFDLMVARGWSTMAERLAFRLPEIGRESGSVEMHLFEKEC